jgi:hypothetical protein
MTRRSSISVLRYLISWPDQGPDKTNDESLRTLGPPHRATALLASWCRKDDSSTTECWDRDYTTFSISLRHPLCQFQRRYWVSVLATQYLYLMYEGFIFRFLF